MQQQIILYLTFENKKKFNNGAIGENNSSVHRGWTLAERNSVKFHHVRLFLPAGALEGGSSTCVWLVAFTTVPDSSCRQARMLVIQSSERTSSKVARSL